MKHTKFWKIDIKILSLHFILKGKNIALQFYLRVNFAQIYYHILIKISECKIWKINEGVVVIGGNSFDFVISK